MSLENVKNIVLVLSGKGGVGKSSITTQLALSLSLAGHSVGVLDVDLTGPSIPRLLGIESAKVRQAPGGWLPVEVHASQTLEAAPKPTFPVPPSDNNGTESANGAGTEATTSIGSLHAMSLAFLLSNRSTAIIWRGPKKTAMVRQFLSSVLWPPLDYLLIDTPPGTSDEHISLVETLLSDLSNPSSSVSNSSAKLAGAVIVTTPQAVSISDVRKELNFCAKTGVRVLGVVENMSGYVCECCGVATNLFSKGGGEVMAKEFGVQFLGGVPIDPQWGVLVERGGRCRYGGVVNDGDGGDDDDDDDDNEEDGEDEKAEIEAIVPGGSDAQPLDEGSLVDRYRSCSLCPIFEAITTKLHETVENETAVMLSPNA